MEPTTYVACNDKTEPALAGCFCVRSNVDTTLERGETKQMVTVPNGGSLMNFNKKVSHCR
jgi:hypothetical protein